MNALKLIWLALIQLPGSVARAFKEGRQERPPSAKTLEAERLDRIRNPSKYLGK
jgi:hypothetical protein